MMSLNILFAAVYFLAMLTALGAFVYLVKKNKLSGNTYFVMILVCCSIGSLFGGLNYLIVNEDIRILFHELKYIGIAPFPAFFLLYVISLFSPDRKPSRVMSSALLILAASCLIVILTNPYHGLFREYITVAQFPGYSLVVCREGPVFYLYVALQWMTYGAALIYLANVYGKPHGKSLKKIIILIAAMAVPIFLHILYLSGGRTVDRFDYTMPLSAVVSIIGILYVASDSATSIVPIARTKIFEYLEIPFFVVNSHKMIVDQNEAAISEYSMLKGKNIQEVDLFKTIDIFSDEKKLVIHDRKIYECSVLPINQEGKVMYYATILQDVTVREAYFEKLKYYTYRDYLTNIYNRRYLFENGADFVQNTESCYIIVGDINCFKSYNDTLGHSAGDSVLVKVAGVLDQYMGRSGIVCRYGGDEFVVLLANNSEEAVVDLIRSVQNELIKEEIEMAFGYVFVSDPRQDLGSMIRQADVRMYVNKEQMKHKNP